MNISNQYQRVVPFIIFILALFLLFEIVRPMITILLSSALLAYISYPLHKYIMKRIPNRSISIILSLFIIISLILIPFIFLTVEISQQGYYFYTSLSSNIEKGALYGLSCTSELSKICRLLNQAEIFSLERLSKFGFDKQLKSFLPILEEEITKFILSIPIIIAKIFITVIISYFILSSWETMMKKIADLLPMRKKTINRLITEFSNITHTVVYAQLFVAFIQGFIGTLGFWMFGVPFPILFGVIMAFCALIPNIGTAIIWVPASLFLILSGEFTSNFSMIGKGIALFLYGILLISTIDNILLAKIVKAKANVNQIAVIIGVIGGASLFGVVGVFIGPILLPLLLTYFETFKERYNH